MNTELIIVKKEVELVRCGNYIACSDGRIFKMNDDKIREVKQSKHNCGYLVFGFNRKMMLSHRFIAMCFIPNPNNLPEINHKNEIKTDNRVENLEWCDRKYNVNYGTRNKRAAKSMIGKNKWKNKGGKLNHVPYSKPVSQFTKSGVFVADYPSIKEAHRKTCLDVGHISACCRGKRKSTGGYIWRYKEDV